MLNVQKINRKYDYSDLDLDFISNPTTGDIVKKTGLDAIKRSIRNLVMTNFYDRPFRHNIGSSAQKILFDNINPFTAIYLKDAITEVINNFEPRVRLASGQDDGVLVTVHPDGNGYNVSLTFTILNTGVPANISLFLERIR
jgi:phage baseplate assembly protein W